MAKKKATKKTAVVKKKWYTILAPKIFNESKIGEIYLAEATKAKGRKMRVNLMGITGEPQKQNFEVTLALKDITENQYRTELLSYKMLASAAKKMIRRNRQKVADSFVIKSKDGKIFRIKPIAVTRGKTTNSVLTAIRKFIRAEMATQISKMTFEEFVQNVLGKRLQQETYKKIRKFYPLSIFDIRAFNLLSEKELKKANVLQPPKEAPKKEE